MTCKKSHVTHHTSHVTRHTSHITRHTSHVTRHTSHVTRHTSHVTFMGTRRIAEKAAYRLECLWRRGVAVVVREDGELQENAACMTAEERGGSCSCT